MNERSEMSRTRVRATRAVIRSLAIAVLLGVGLAASEPGFGATITLEPTKDNTLIESADGSLSNGAGPAVFAGRTGQSSNSIRRALLAFDVVGNLPAGSVIERVSLVLHRTGGPELPDVLSLHRLHSDWGEGASSFGGGSGAPATSGDATWIHTFYDPGDPTDPDDRWDLAGGDFEIVPSASVFAVFGDEFRWASSGMVSDVEAWLDGSASDYGWILRGDESQSSSSVKLASREYEILDYRPSLTIDYSIIPEPSTALLVACGLVGLAVRRRRVAQRNAASCVTGGTSREILPRSSRFS
jgi:hypothetical protein